jgi:hypothetical protein
MRPSLSVDHFQLLSNTTLALYFRGLGGYDISAPETIAIEVPASAVSSGQVPPSVPSFTITASAGVAAFTSDGLALARGAPCMTASSCAAAEALLNSSNELAISGPQTLQVVIELLGNTFRHDVGHDRWASEAVLSSLFASGGARESSGWNRVVRPLLGRSSRYLTRLSDSRCLPVCTALSGLTSAVTLSTGCATVTLVARTTRQAARGCLTLGRRAPPTAVHRPLGTSTTSSSSLMPSRSACSK